MGKFVAYAGILTICFLYTVNPVPTEAVETKRTTSQGMLAVEKGTNETAPAIIVANHEKEGVTKQTGDLTIDYLPSLVFSLTKKTATTGYYGLTSNRKINQSFVQVSDRSGTGDGWQLDLSIGPFIGKKGGTLSQGTITVDNLTFLTTERNVSDPPVFKEKIVYLLGEKTVRKTLIKANKNEGMHSWATQFENENQKIITMEIPLRGVVTDQYTSTFLWELLTAPSE